MVCHFCGSPDHRAMHCPVTTAELIEKEREAVKLKREAEKQVSNTVIYSSVGGGLSKQAL